MPRMVIPALLTRRLLRQLSSSSRPLLPPTLARRSHRILRSSNAEDTSSLLNDQTFSLLFHRRREFFCALNTARNLHQRKPTRPRHSVKPTATINQPPAESSQRQRECQTPDDR